MEQNNKLIAEFMGIKFNKGTFYNMGYDVFSDGNLYRSHEMKYHTSWDWLIPVVKKCLRTGDNTDQWDEIYNSLSTVNKEIVYNQVIKFIEIWNKTD